MTEHDDRAPVDQSGGTPSEDTAQPPAPSSAWDYLRVHPPSPRTVPVVGGTMFGGKIEPSIGHIQRKAGLGASPEDMKRLVRDVPKFSEPE